MFPDHDAIGMVGSLLREHIMAIITDAARDIADRIAVIKVNQQQLPSGHGLKLQFGFHEIVRTNDPAKIQFFIGPAMSGHSMAVQTCEISI